MVNREMIRRLIFSFLLLSATLPVQAQTIHFREMFDTNGPLIGLTPNVSSGNWSSTGGGVQNPMTVSSNRLNVGGFGQDAYAPFASPVFLTAGNRMFTAVDINVATATATGDYFLHMTNSIGSQSFFYQQLHIRASGTGFQLGLSSAADNVAYGAEMNLNQNYRIVTSWEFVAGASNDVFNVYVDPTDGIQGNNTAYIANYVWTGNPEPSNQIPAINVRQGSAGFAGSLTVDRLIVANNFSVVSFFPVPEPTIVFGFAATVIGLICRYRKTVQ